MAQQLRFPMLWEAVRTSWRRAGADRDWLTQSGWDKKAPGPMLPDDVVEQTRAKYVEAYELLTGSSFDSYLRS